MLSGALASCSEPNIPKVILPDALLTARSPKPLGIGDPTPALLAQSPSVLRIPTNLLYYCQILNEIFNPNEILSEYCC